MTGLEPATSGVTGRRSNQLSYTRIHARSMITTNREEAAGYPATTTVSSDDRLTDTPMGTEGQPTAVGSGDKRS